MQPLRKRMSGGSSERVGFATQVVSLVRICSRRGRSRGLFMGLRAPRGNGLPSKQPVPPFGARAPQVEF
eukprot:11157930-Lingulodinium_polyedra.AAC.1